LTKISPKRKILIGSEKPYDEEYYFKARIHEDSKKGTQIYGMGTENVDDMDTRTDNMTPSSYLISLRQIENWGFLEDAKRECRLHFFLRFLKFCRSIFLALSLIFFGLFMGNTESPRQNLSSAIFLGISALVCGSFLDALSLCIYRGRGMEIPGRILLFKFLYFLGVASFISSLILFFVAPDKSDHTISACIASLFCAGFSGILCYYLFVGWLFSSKFEFYSLLITGVGSMIGFGLKVYEWLYIPSDFWVPLWILTLIFLAIAHGIIFTYELLLKTTYSLRDFCTEFKSDFNGCKENTKLLFFLGFYFCFYIILELMILLKLNGDLPENWNWLCISTPAFFMVLFDLALMGNVIVKAIKSDRAEDIKFT
jgi:hypothetical protein